MYHAILGMLYRSRDLSRPRRAVGSSAWWLIGARQTGVDPLRRLAARTATDAGRSRALRLAQMHPDSFSKRTKVP